MYRKTFYLAGLSVLLTAAGCVSHYELAGIQRTRVLVDNRYDAAPDVGAAKFMEPFKQKVDSVMGPVVGEVDHDMVAHRPESDLSNLLADIMVWAARDYNEKVDFGVYNMGGIRAALSKGKITYGDVLDIAPFENKICFVTLTGEKVLELFSQMAHTGGEAVSHGVELVFTHDHKLKSARLNGKEIDPKASYRISTLDYLAQGNDKMEAFKSATDVVSSQATSNNTRFIIMNYFKEQTAQGRIVNAHTEGRIRVE
ncbi:5'-nucleotidase C-terminal domain-containing protein [Prevotella denticola]|uniref:5'-nucleotidase C-terminal domain-containing protein n=1 Tax=Prevotella denticola TaxID=28129 RepID=UPI001C5CF661|nr:5'-nucleotidase [Prevotella denticola]MBW4897557.1 5'-nucleotidase C-terminal domain-containing protein [Prevotella denticola]